MSIPAICEDLEVKNRIEKLANYVVRNGVEFEDVVRKKEAGNEKFGFLDNDGQHYIFYRWTLYCVHNKLTENMVSQIIKECNDRIRDIYPGSLNLTEQDANHIKILLESNNGGRDTIKSTRQWIMDRSHSSVAIGHCISKYCKNYRERHDIPQSVIFQKILHTMYVLNDVFFNAPSAFMKGVYTTALENNNNKQVDIVKCMYPQLGYLLNIASILSPDSTSRDKLHKLIGLWQDKGFLTTTQREELSMVISSPASNPTLPANDVVLHSPHVIKPSLPIETLPHTNPYGHHSTAPPPPPPVPLGVPPMMRPPPQQVFPPQAFGSVVFPPTQIIPPPMQQNSIGRLQTHSQSQSHMDISKLSVGLMSNILKGALKIGHPKYSPLALSAFAFSMPPHIEPSRLEARVSEFYKTVSGIKHKADNRSDEDGTSREHRTRNRSRSRSRDRRQRASSQDFDQSGIRDYRHGSESESRGRRQVSGR
jgi:hypothetical protein